MEYYTNINHRIFKVWTNLLKENHNQEFVFDIVNQVLISTIRKYADPELSPGLQRNENNYVWLKHSYIIEQLPCLKIKEEALKKRLKQLVDVGILQREYKFLNNNNKAMKKVFYKVSDIFDQLEMILIKQDSIEKKNITQDEKERQKKNIQFPSIPNIINNSLTKNNQRRDQKGKFAKAKNTHTVTESRTVPVSQSLTPWEINPLHHGNKIPLDSYTTHNINNNKNTKYNKTNKEIDNITFMKSSLKEIPQYISDEETIKKREENKKKFDLTLLDIFQ